MWKILNHECRGTSHLKANLPCQDMTFRSVFQTDAGHVFVAVLSDGAGSAQFSQEGAKATCHTVVASIGSLLGEGMTISDLTKEKVVETLQQARSKMQELAKERAVSTRELACTVLGAVIGPTCSVFFQLGDGVMVVWNGSEYRHVFWPDQGEYANTTNFLSADNFERYLQFRFDACTFDEFAAMSDGLQKLALNYSLQGAHAPFFEQVFAWLRRAKDDEEVDLLVGPFQKFLDSPAINERTDDDKSLILATRITVPNGRTAS